MNNSRREDLKYAYLEPLHLACSSQQKTNVKICTNTPAINTQITQKAHTNIMIKKIHDSWNNKGDGHHFLTSRGLHYETRVKNLYGHFAFKIKYAWVLNE